MPLRANDFQAAHKGCGYVFFSVETFGGNDVDNGFGGVHVAADG